MTQRTHVSSVAFPRFLASALLLFSLAVAGKAGTVNFSSPKDYPAGKLPQAVAVGDFNADGALDLAVANLGDPSTGDPGGVSILLGYGDGTFRAPMSFGAGANPNRIAVADFNGDGKLSLVVATIQDPSTGLANVNILLTRGDGTFQPPVTVDQTYYTFVVVDFNGDKKSDLAFPISSGTRILLGKGDGSFQAPIDFTISEDFWAAGDFNGDGKLDLLAFLSTSGSSETFFGELRVHLGNGDGTFRSDSVTTAVGGYAHVLCMGDFNRDNRLDLVGWVKANVFARPSLELFLGNGDGTFQAPKSVGIGASSAASDFDGDGKLDLAVDPLPPSQLSLLVLLGNGDGTFQSGFTTPIAYLAEVVVGDLNQDGMPDLVLNHGSTADTVTVLLNLTPNLTPGFLVSASPDALTVTAGASANTTLNVAPANGFNEAVALTCSGAPREATCSVSPASVTLNGTDAATASLTVTTTARTSALVLPWAKPSVMGRQWSPAWTAFLLALALLMVLASRRRAAPSLRGLVLAATLLLVVFWGACGEERAGCNGLCPDTGTPAGTYPLTITATSGSFVQSTTVKLTVQ